MQWNKVDCIHYTLGSISSGLAFGFAENQYNLSRNLPPLCNISLLIFHGKLKYKPVKLYLVRNSLYHLALFP